MTEAEPDIVESAMGPEIRRVLRGWWAMYRGPCPHKARSQLATPRDRTSACWECHAASGATAAWTEAGPCSVCAAPMDPPSRVWEVPAGSVVVLLRLCPLCTVEQATEPRKEDR
ncbi:hypothetical protein [uncultured Amnibacterium sp.]|uniref:hypothetical protein n=1 Tax=uncultured Amnibacterium sp. TaxID=1631851 RepID=UPI0035CBF4ED